MTNIFQAKVMLLYRQACNWRLTIFLAFSLILGGTSLYTFDLKVPLYFISVWFIAHALMTQNRPLKSLMRPPIVFGGLFILLYFLFLIPLPPDLWTTLPGRNLIVENYDLTQTELRWMPLSLAPRLTFESIFNFLPVVAIVFMMRLSRNDVEIRIAEKSIMALASLSFTVGLIGLLIGTHIFSVYNYYTIGSPVGFFTNINHQASFSAAALPLAIYYAFKPRDFDSAFSPQLFIFSLVSGALIVTSLLSAGSLAGFAFLLSNACLAFYVMCYRKRYALLFLTPVVITLVALFMDALFFKELLGLLSKLESNSMTSRSEVYSSTLKAMKTFSFYGSGPGSFDAVHRMFENPDQLTNKYSNEAHNEYLQIYLELGVLGAMVLVGSILWFILRLKSVFSFSHKINKKACILGISILTLILHSMVDFPLRTMAMSAIFTFILMRFDEVSAK